MFETVIQYLESLSADGVEHFAADDRNVAIAALFYHVIAVDGVIMPVEKIRFQEVLERKFGFCAEKLAELSAQASKADLQSSGLFPFTSIINHECSDAEKIKIVGLMKLLAQSDGEFHPLEAQLIQNVEELLKLTPLDDAEAAE